MSSSAPTTGTARAEPNPLKRYWLTRPWLALLWVVVFALLMASAQQGLALWRAANMRLAGACWIWADEPGKDPLAFYAAQDFELSDTLAANAAARLAIVADESYVVYLNGHYVGSNRYGQDAPIDAYDVTGWLRGGRNRVVVELRSERGVGGLLADLRVNSADSLDRVRPVLATDGAWRIFRRHDDGLFDLQQDLSAGEPALVWQMAPTGRWRLSGELRSRPPWKTEKRPKRRSPQRMQGLYDETWKTVKTPRRRLPRVGPKVLFDWGETVQGFLSVDLPSSEAAPALVYVSEEALPDPQTEAPDHILLPIPGTSQWRDLVPRRFRYVLFVGLEPEGRIETRLVDDAILEQLTPPPARQGGVFGLSPALQHTAVEEQVWQRLVSEARERRAAQQSAQADGN